VDEIWISPETEMSVLDIDGFTLETCVVFNLKSPLSEQFTQRAFENL